MKRLFTVILCIIISLCLMPVSAEEEQKTTDICIVYDNTESTYKSQAWCRYKYLLDVLSKYIDFDRGGQMLIYPTCDVKTDKAEYPAGADPIRITSSDDSYSNIFTLYTTVPTESASFKTVENAYNYLARESLADNKQLIILTDGAFSDMTEEELEAKLNGMADGKIEVCYFATDNAPYISNNEEKGLFTYYREGVVDAQRMLDYILRFCGRPFNRTKLLTSSTPLTTLRIESKCDLVFYANSINGKAPLLQLNDENGDPAYELMYSSVANYSKIRAEGFEDAPLDTSLDGVVGTCYSCKPGLYYVSSADMKWLDVYVQSSGDTAWIDSYIQNNKNDPEKDVYGESEKAAPLPIVIASVLVALIIAAIIIFIFNKKTEKKNYQIFISYRRDGGDALAGRLADRFTRKGYRTFFDVESMRTGVFNEQIFNAIDQCSDVLLILPPNALDRCVNEDDWVRKEIAYSIEKDKNVIPIMMRGFTFPENLPQEIDKVRYMQGITASNEYFDAVIERIEKGLKCRKK